MSALDIADLHKSYTSQAVLRGLSLDVEAGTFLSVLGPSGSGKTTLLRVIAGFERVDSGCVRLDGEIVDDGAHYVPPEERRIGYVPQEGSLFPHLCVERNVGFGLHRKERTGKRVRELLEMVGLGGLERRYPHELSGGQQQRVALARALAINPTLVLLDEPFSSLDASLRATVRQDVRNVLRSQGTTAILVTHDQDEALSLADRVAILREGQIDHCDEPARLYAHPSTPELARGLGEANFLRGIARSGCVDTALGVFPLQETTNDGVALLVLVRPEQLVLSSDADSGAGALVVDTEFYGHDAIVRLRPDFDPSMVLILRTPQAIGLPPVRSHVELAVRGSVVAWEDQNA